MNATNGRRATNGEAFKTFARRSVYAKDYLWDKSKTKLSRPVLPDFNRELFERWQGRTRRQ
jgi:hypothetical protein